MKLSRRNFIHASCSVAAITLAPHFLDATKAAIHGGPAPSGFNGGRSQVNLNTVAGGGDYPFLNLLKGAEGRWTLADNSGGVVPSSLDSNGYLLDPTVCSVHGGVYTEFNIPGNNTYVITWKETGTLILYSRNGLGTITTVSGSLSNTAPATGSYSFTTSGVTGVSTPSSTKRICHSRPRTHRTCRP